VDGLKRFPERAFADTGDARQLANPNAFSGVVVQEFRGPLNQPPSGQPGFTRLRGLRRHGRVGSGLIRFRG